MFPNQWSLDTRIHDDNTRCAGDPTPGRQRRVPHHPVPEDQQHLHRWVRVRVKDHCQCQWPAWTAAV